MNKLHSKDFEILTCIYHQKTYNQITIPWFKCSDFILILLKLFDNNEKLERLWCYSNQLTSLPPLNENLKEVYFSNNPISEIINGETKNEIKKQIQLLNNFRHLYYSLKFKKKFRDWLWMKIREPKAMKKYHPGYLVDNLKEYTELDSFLDNWF